MPVAVAAPAAASLDRLRAAVFGPLARELTFDAGADDSNEVRELRTTVITAAAAAGEEWALQQVRERFEPLATSGDDSRINPDLLRAVLSNAVRYGPGKPVEVRLRRQDGRARLEVVDHGLGVKPEDRARIFNRFERAVSVRHYGGLGLGLWVSRQVVEAHGGSITVSDTPGGGATLTVELPLQAPE